MGQELQVPQAFQGKGMSQAFSSQLNAQDDNLSDGIGQSYGVIGYKGKVWSIRYRGERKTVIRPDDGTPSAHLDVIVLGQAKQKSKSYYKKYDPNTSDGDRPICSSIDGVVPDADVAVKQCDSCAICPKNIWKTDAVAGRKGRECTDYKRLAVLILPTQSRPTLGSPLMEPVFLRVPPDSLNSLAIMGETMAAQGFHFSSYITRITFDPLKAHPCMVFRPLQPLSDQEAPVILDLRNDATVGRITGGDLAVAGMKAVETALQPAGTAATGIAAAATQTATTVPAAPQQQPVQQTTVQPAQQSSASAQHSSNPLVGAALGLTQTSGLAAPNGAALPVTPSPTIAPTATTQPQSASTGLVDTGFGGASTASDTAGPQAATLTAADAGAAEESDEDLDARIASLIAPK